MRAQNILGHWSYQFLIALNTVVVALKKELKFAHVLMYVHLSLRPRRKSYHLVEVFPYNAVFVYQKKKEKEKTKRHGIHWHLAASSPPTRTSSGVLFCRSGANTVLCAGGGRERWTWAEGTGTSRTTGRVCPGPVEACLTDHPPCTYSYVQNHVKESI